MKLVLVIFLIVMIYEAARLWAIVFSDFASFWKTDKAFCILSALVALLVSFVAGALLIPISKFWRLL